MWPHLFGPSSSHTTTPVLGILKGPQAGGCRWTDPIFFFCFWKCGGTLSNGTAAANGNGGTCRRSRYRKDGIVVGTTQTGNINFPLRIGIRGSRSDLHIVDLGNVRGFDDPLIVARAHARQAIVDADKEGLERLLFFRHKAGRQSFQDKGNDPLLRVDDAGRNTTTIILFQHKIGRGGTGRCTIVVVKGNEEGSIIGFVLLLVVGIVIMEPIIVPRCYIRGIGPVAGRNHRRIARKGHKGIGFGRHDGTCRHDGNRPRHGQGDSHLRRHGRSGQGGQHSCSYGCRSGRCHGGSRPRRYRCGGRLGTAQGHLLGHGLRDMSSRRRGRMGVSSYRRSVHGRRRRIIRRPRDQFFHDGLLQVTLFFLSPPRYAFPQFGHALDEQDNAQDGTKGKPEGPSDLLFSQFGHFSEGQGFGGFTDTGLFEFHTFHGGIIIIIIIIIIIVIITTTINGRQLLVILVIVIGRMMMMIHGMSGLEFHVLQQEQRSRRRRQGRLVVIPGRRKGSFQIDGFFFLFLFRLVQSLLTHVATTSIHHTRTSSGSQTSIHGQVGHVMVLATSTIICLAIRGRAQKNGSQVRQRRRSSQQVKGLLILLLMVAVGVATRSIVNRTAAASRVVVVIAIRWLFLVISFKDKDG